MQHFINKHFIVFLCLIFVFVLIPAAFAEDDTVQTYDTGVITGFEPGTYQTVIDTDYKYALIELEKEFPSQLPIRLGGRVSYKNDQDGSKTIAEVKDYITQNIDVTWNCQENYDEDLKTFHFVPNIGNYKLAAGLEFPVITVNVSGKLEIPPLYPIPEEEHRPFTIEEDSSAEIVTAPSYYNNYSSGKLPEIRDQNPYGSCWAHASIAAVEADLIHDGKAKTSIDLSELHLAYFTYHKFKDEKGLNTHDIFKNMPKGVGYLDYGGNSYIAAHTLTNMLGPVKESAAPYTSASTYSPNASKGRTGSYHITGSYVLNIKNDRNSVKNAIINHGAVAVSFNADGNYYSYTNNSFYCPVTTDTNHAVAIVGWDDNFSSSKFNSGTPEGNGAWLIRNSWGVNGYHFYGYFWMSYYDKSLDQYARAYDALPGRYDNVYAYDNTPPLGWVKVNRSVSQSFYVDGYEEVRAIGFYTEDANLGVKFTVSSGNSSVTKSINTTAPGYYLVTLPKTLKIQRKSKVTVSYSFTSGKERWAYCEYGKYGWTDGPEFIAGLDSGGMVVDGNTYSCDGKIKLFTSKLEKLSIPDGNVLGYDKVIEVKIPSKKNQTTFQVTVADAASGTKIDRTITKRWDSSGTNIILRIESPKFVNGKIYKITIRRVVNGTAGLAATVYGMPHKPNTRVTVGPYGGGASLISSHQDSSVLTRYNIHDVAKSSFVKAVTPAGTGKSGNVTGLTNGRLYYVAARPYKVYKGHYCYGPLTLKVHFVPLTAPDASKVKLTWSGTSVKVTMPKDSAATGISVLVRQQGKTIKKGCEAKGNACTVKGLNKNFSYEFYVMKYKTVNSRNYYGSAMRVRHKVDFAGMNAPKNPYLAIGNDGKAAISATLDKTAQGISVLIREGEGAFKQFCESKSSSCFNSINTSKRYSFIVMQYRTVNGKKVYSSGVTVRNWISSKSAEGFDMTDFVVDDKADYNLNDIYEALPDYITEDDLLQAEIWEALGYDPTDGLYAKDADFTDDPFMDAFDENLESYEGPEEFIEDADDTDWSPEDISDDPVEGGDDITDPTEDPTGGEEDSDGNPESEFQSMEFYWLSGAESYPYDSGTPSFDNKLE